MATPSNHPPPPRWLKSSGNATLGLIRDPDFDDHRLAPILRLVDDRGGTIVIKLTHQEIDGLRADANKLFDADQKQVTRWWQSLADGTDGRPRLPVAHIPSRDATARTAARSAPGPAS